MIQDWKQHLTSGRAEQCLRGTEFIIGLVQKLQPKVYIETGSAHLTTFQLYHSMLPKDGLAIGVDIREYGSWPTYNPHGYCRHYLLLGGLGNPGTVKDLDFSLGDRKIDLAFIDGDHTEEGVQTDWDVIAPRVRKGGLIVFHDYDPGAVAAGRMLGQGAAILCDKLSQRGFTIQSIKNTAVGTAYIYKS